MLGVYFVGSIDTVAGQFFAMLVTNFITFAR